MFAQLPESLQKEVMFYLRTDFQRAKKIHDTWMEKQNNCSSPSLQPEEKVVIS